MLVFSIMDLMSVVILPCWVGSIQVPLFEQSILCPAVHDEIIWHSLEQSVSNCESERRRKCIFPPRVDLLTIDCLAFHATHQFLPFLQFISTFPAGGTISLHHTFKSYFKSSSPIDITFLIFHLSFSGPKQILRDWLVYNNNQNIFIVLMIRQISKNHVVLMIRQISKNHGHESPCFPACGHISYTTNEDTNSHLLSALFYAFFK